MIDVILPVGGDRAHVARTLARARATTARPFRALVIDDSGSRSTPTEPLPPGTFVFGNRSRRGFAGSVNRGIRMSRSDIVVVSPGTILPEGWLESLEESARSRPRVGTVTPIATRGGFASPDVELAEADLAPAARALADAKLSHRALIPFALTACVLLRREALDAAGSFDETAYPEPPETGAELSLRLARRGFLHLLDDRVLVGRDAAGSEPPDAISALTDPRGRFAREEPVLAELLASFRAEGSLEEVAHRVRRAVSSGSRPGEVR